jgi:hypothetical protein
MTQCAGTTQKGERCKRESTEGSAYCAIHRHQDARSSSAAAAPDSGAKGHDPEWMLKAALGFAALAAIVWFRIRWRPPIPGR